MSGWTAVVPFKGGEARKSRLAPCLSPAERLVLTGRMAAHVLSALAAVPAIARTLLLAPAVRPPLDADWVADHGGGLNEELERLAQTASGPMLIVHADLPFVAPADLTAMLEAAGSKGAAIAPDRAGTGTNALALIRPAGVRLAFGPNSFARHAALLGVAGVVRREGLGFDIDTPADLAAARDRPEWLALYGS